MQRKPDAVKLCACGCKKKLVRKRYPPSEKHPNGRLESTTSFNARKYWDQSHYFEARYHGLFTGVDRRDRDRGNDGR